MRLIRRSTPALALAILLLPRIAPAQPHAEPHSEPAPADLRASVTPDDWRSDFRLLIEELEAVHPDPWFHADRAAVVRAVEELEDRLPSMSWEESFAGMNRIVAMLRDGHTRVRRQGNRGFSLRRAQVLYHLFPEGLYVIHVHPDHAEILGGRVTRIGNTDVDEAIARMSPLVPADNDYTVLDRLPGCLTTVELLAGVGVLDRTDDCPVEVEKDGRRIRTVLPVDVVHDESSWPNVLAAAGTDVPLYLRDPEKSYFLELLPERNAAFLLSRRVRNDEGESFAEFCERAFATLEEKQVDRLVVDLRLNGGGNNFLNRPLIHGIIRNDRINRRGHLFVVTGRSTFSAAMCGTIDLERQTEALFVGEPTGATPNHHGDAVLITLPRTGVTVAISAVHWQNSDPRDHRPWVEPQLPAAITWDDYVHGRDPALEAALAYEPYEGEVTHVAPMLIAELDAGTPVPELLARFDQLRATPEGRRYRLDHWQLNALGYELLARERPDEALTVLRRNVELFPWQGNPWDSLGEVLAQTGHVEEAVDAYRRSLELNPANGAGQLALRRLTRSGESSAAGTN